MGISFLAPVLLSGLTLLVLPWLIHQIRRPERETLLFGSLMFFPKVKREVIERRNIQHFLLMLLRMLILVLLILAFSRPYRSVVVLPEEEQESARHVILIDRSYSMAAADHFQQAKEQALRILDEIPNRERVSVIGFDEQPVVLNPLFAEGEDVPVNRRRAEQAVNALTLGQRTTAYRPALQAAEDVLLQNVNPESDEQLELVLHFISDFQSPGMPESESSWKLSSSITFKPVVVGESEYDHFSITDVHLQKTLNNELKITGQIKNWSPEEMPLCELTLSMEDQEIETRSLYIQPGNTSNVSFTIPYEPDQIQTGRLEIGNDVLSIDNRRYFAWNPIPKKKVFLIAGETSTQPWPAEWFLERAFSIDENKTWEIRRATPTELIERLLENASPPDMVIVCDRGEMNPVQYGRLLRYVREGGRVLLILDQGNNFDVLNASLLSALQIQATGFRYSETQEEQYEMLAWIDFDHPVFIPFQDSQYNDFSHIRFYNYVFVIPEKQGTTSESELDIRCLARFEGEEGGIEPPAMLDIPYGEGAILLWVYSPILEWTNLPKSSKFVPLLFESLAYLSGDEKEAQSILVGDSIVKSPRIFDSASSCLLQIPAENSERTVDHATLQERPIELNRAGYLRWRSENQSPVGFVHAVNINTGESDLRKVTVEEFSRKLCSQSFLEREEVYNIVANQMDESENIYKDEFGLIILLFLLLWILTESWYSSWLAKSEKKKEAN